MPTPITSFRDATLLLVYVNRVVDAAEFARLIRADPAFGTGIGPGLTPADAQRVIDHRPTLGARQYIRVEDLLQVPGLGRDAYHNIVWSFTTMRAREKALLYVNHEDEANRFSALVVDDPRSAGAQIGIDVALAQRVLDFRATVPNQSFSSLGKLLNVSGFDAEALRDLVYSFGLQSTASVNHPPDVQIDNVAVRHGRLIEVDYTVYDPESDLVSVVASYTLDRAATLRAASVGAGSDPLTSLPSSPTGRRYRFVWDAGADLGRVHQTMVAVHLQVRDARPGGSALSRRFDQNVRSATSGVDILVPAAGAVASPVLVEFVLRSSTSTPMTVEGSYSLDGGATYARAQLDPSSPPLTSLPSSPTGETHQLLWDAAADLGSGGATDVHFRIAASSTGTSAEDSVGPFDVDRNTPPLVDIWSQSRGPATSSVNVDYVLTDPDSDPVDVLPEYSLDAGTTYTRATEGPGGSGVAALTTSPTGEGHRFVWDAAADLTGSARTGILFRITASDSQATGVDVVGPFDVGGATGAVDVVVPHGSRHGSPVPLRFSLVATPAGTSRVEIDYSLDGGATFTAASAAPNVGSEALASMSASPGGDAHFFAWDAASDVGAGSHSTVVLRVRANGAGGLAEALSSAFEVTDTLTGTDGAGAGATAPPELRALFTKNTYRGQYVPLRFVVADSGSRRVDVVAEFDDGTGFRTATAAPGSDRLVGLAAPDGGLDYRFIWDAAADLGSTPNAVPVVVRMRAFAGSTQSAPAEESCSVLVEPWPAVPTPAAVPSVSGTTIAVHSGDQQTVAGGFLSADPLVVLVTGPDSSGSNGPLPGVTVSFKATTASGVPVQVQEDPHFGTTTRYDGKAGVRVRAPIVTGAEPIDVTATIVGMPGVQSTFSLAAAPGRLVVDGPSEVFEGRWTLLRVTVDADGDPTTQNFAPEPDAPLLLHAQSSQAVIDTQVPRVPELGLNLHGTSGAVVGIGGVARWSPSDDRMRVTVDAPGRGDLAPATFDAPIRHPAFAQRLSSYPSSTYADVELLFEVVSGEGPGGQAQRAYPGVTLTTPFQVRLVDRQGREFHEGINGSAGGCGAPPNTERLRVEWGGTNLLLSDDPANPRSGILDVTIDTPVYATPIGHGPWHLRVTSPRVRLIRDNLAQAFQYVTSNGDPACHQQHAFRGTNSRSQVRGTFVIGRAAVEMVDAATRQPIDTLRAGEQLRVLCSGLSPYRVSTAAEPVDLDLALPDGRTPFVQNGVRGAWSHAYGMHPDTPSTLISDPIWIAQGDSEVPAGWQNQIQATIPNAHVTALSNSIGVQVRTVDKTRHRIQVAGVATRQESPAAASPMSGEVCAVNGELMFTATDLRFTTRNGTLAVSRSYRGQLAMSAVDDGPLGPCWHLDSHDFLDVSRGVPRWWRSGRFDDVRRYVFSANASRGLFVRADLRDTIAPDQSAFEISDAYGEVAHFNADGSIRFVDDRLGNRRTYQYDRRARLEYIRDPLDPSSRYIRFHYWDDPAVPEWLGRLVKVSDFTGRQVDYSYYRNGDTQGGGGWLKRVEYPACPTMRGGPQPNATYRRSETYEYEPDDALQWRLKTVRNSDDAPRTTYFYADNRVVRRIAHHDATRDETTTFAFPNALQTVVGELNGTATRFTFPASPWLDGTLASEIVEDANGIAATTTMQCNRRGLIVSVGPPGQGAVEYAYDETSYDPRQHANVEAVIENAPPGSSLPPRITTYRYDRQSNRITEMVPPEGNAPSTEPDMYATRYAYDGDGNLTAVRPPRVLNGYLRPPAEGGGNRWIEESPKQLMAYSPVHRRLISVQDPMGVVTTLEYYSGNDPTGAGGSTPSPDGAGLLARVTTDALTTPERTLRLGRTTPLDPRQTVYSYNRLGDTTSVVTPRGVIHTLHINPLHEVNAVALASGTADVVSVAHWFDADGNPARAELAQPNASPTAARTHVVEEDHDRQSNPIASRTRIRASGANAWLSETREFQTDGSVRSITLPYQARHTAASFHFDTTNGGLQATARYGDQTATIQSSADGSLVEQTSPSGAKIAERRDGFGESHAWLDARQNLISSLKTPAGAVVRSVVQTGATSTTPAPALTHTHVVEARYDELGNRRREHSATARIPPSGTSPTGARLPEPSEFLAPGLPPLPALERAGADGALGPGDGRRTADTAYNAWQMPTRLLNDETGWQWLRHNAHGEVIEARTSTGNRDNLTRDMDGNVVEHEEVVRFHDGTGWRERSFFKKAEFDAHGRLVVGIDGEGNATRFRYDEANLLVEFSDPLGTDSSDRYRGKAINAPGNVTKIDHDDLGRVVETEHSLAGSVTGGGGPVVLRRNPSRRIRRRFEYHDDGGPLRAFIDDAGYRTEYEYDAQARLQFIHQHATVSGSGPVRSSELAYEPNTGAISSFEDANGTVLDYTHVAGAVTAVRASLPTTPSPSARLDGATSYSITYDGQYNLESITDNTTAFSVLRSHDTDGRVLSERQGAVTVDYAFEGDRTETIIYPGSPTRAVARHYERQGRLESVEDAGARIAFFHYVGNTRLRRREYGSLSVTYEHDDAGRLMSQTVLGASGQAIQFQLTRDRASRVRSCTRAQGTSTESVSYDYDSAGRLLKETADYGRTLERIRYFDADDVLLEEEWDVEQAGAVLRRSSVRQRAERGRLTEVDATSISFDAVGNLIDDGTRRYTYDPWGRLTAIEESNEPSIRYVYDGFHRLVRRERGDDVEHYVYDGWHLIEIRDGNGTVLQRFVYSDIIDDLLRVEVGGQEFIVVRRPDGSVDSLFDDSGNLVESYRYALSGEHSVFDRMRAAVSSPARSCFLFQGRRWDTEARLYYYRRRWYDPRLGVFLTPDPVGELDTPNVYLLCGGDPINSSDPYGHQDKKQEPDKTVQKESKPVNPYLRTAVRSTFALEGLRARLVDDALRVSFAGAKPPPGYVWLSRFHGPQAGEARFAWLRRIDTIRREGFRPRWDGLREMSSLWKQRGVTRQQLDSVNDELRRRSLRDVFHRRGPLLARIIKGHTEIEGLYRASPLRSLSMMTPRQMIKTLPGTATERMFVTVLQAPASGVKDVNETLNFAQRGRALQTGRLVKLAAEREFVGTETLLRQSREVRTYINPEHRVAKDLRKLARIAKAANTAMVVYELNDARGKPDQAERSFRVLSETAGGYAAAKAGTALAIVLIPTAGPITIIIVGVVSAVAGGSVAGELGAAVGRFVDNPAKETRRQIGKHKTGRELIKGWDTFNSIGK